jgi:hypothetical protein
MTKPTKPTKTTTRKPAARRTTRKKPVEVTFDHIATRAYFIHLEEGGDPHENWLRARARARPRVTAGPRRRARWRPAARGPVLHLCFGGQGRRAARSVVIRFAGDSGDGMQLTGGQFTSETALLGNDLSTFPDFPAEIRAPAGSLPGVSGFQLHFADHDILTPGDRPDVLVAMNPAALKTNLKDLVKGGTLIVNRDAFTERNLDKAGYTANPLEDGSLGEFQVHDVG